MNLARRWTLGVGLAVAAWLVISVTPDHREHTAAPVPVPATIGESVEASGMTVTVTGVRMTDGLQPPGGSPISGRWVVVDLAVISRDSDLENPVGGVGLQLNDTLITSSDLIYREQRIDGFQLRTGLVVSGSILFQIAPDAPLGDATVMIGRRSSDDVGVWSDDQVQLVVDLAAIPLETDLSFEAPTVKAAP